MTALTTTTGIVSKVKDTSFELQEEPGNRYRISQFADPRPELPRVGEHVALGLDSKGFVRTLDLLDGAPLVTTSQPGVILSTRLACLEAAVRFLACREEAKSTNVLDVAERFESWATR